jgi:hypothetical protein
MSADLFDAYRPALTAELRRVVEDVSLTHGALLREELARLTDGKLTSQESLLPSLLCLLTADALTGQPDEALPAATSLALLDLMADAFGQISAGEADQRSLTATWGMPRALNAGDAFFVLAQDALLSAQNLDAERKLAAIALMEEASRSVSERLHARAAGEQANAFRELLCIAAALGALSAGAGAESIEAVRRFGSGQRGVGAEAVGRATSPSDQSGNANLTSFTEAARAKLRAAGEYIAGVTRA